MLAKKLQEEAKESYDIIKSNNLGNISPVILDSTNNSFNYLDSPNSRTLVLVEFDFMKFNLPNFSICQ